MTRDAKHLNILLSLSLNTRCPYNLIESSHVSYGLNGANMFLIMACDALLEKSAEFKSIVKSPFSLIPISKRTSTHLFSLFLVGKIKTIYFLENLSIQRLDLKALLTVLVINM